MERKILGLSAKRVTNVVSSLFGVSRFKLNVGKYLFRHRYPSADELRRRRQPKPTGAAAVKILRAAEPAKFVLIHNFITN